MIAIYEATTTTTTTERPLPHSFSTIEAIVHAPMESRAMPRQKPTSPQLDDNCKRKGGHCGWV